MFPFEQLAEIARLEHEAPRETALMLYRRRQHPEAQLQTEWVALTEMEPTLLKAIVLSEDINFWRHSGFSGKGYLRAARHFLRYRKLRIGGSTISQQLIKNLFLEPQRTFARKAKEALLTIWLERILSKPRILELYLNVIEWGPDVWGWKRAVRHYFNHSKEDGPLQSIIMVSFVVSPLTALRQRGLTRSNWLQFSILSALRGRGLITTTHFESMWTACCDLYAEGIMTHPKELPVPLAMRSTRSEQSRPFAMRLALRWQGEKLAIRRTGLPPGDYWDRHFADDLKFWNDRPSP